MKQQLLLLFILCTTSLWAQEPTTFNYQVEATGIASDNGHAPLWLTANRNGITSTRENQALLHAGIFYQQPLKHNWQLQAGLDLVGGHHLISNFWVHQAYADISWKMLNLSIGSKERGGFPLERNTQLTSGWMVEGMNARPIPQIRGEIKEYWNIPGLNHWLALKGHLAFGWFMDGNWQEDFVAPHGYYTKEALYQSKSLMFRLGNKDKFPVDFEFGILMATQFGGEQYRKKADGTSELTLDMPDGLKAYWKAFFPQGGGEDNPNAGERANIEGNALGSWNFALNTYLGDWKIRATYEHYFEDHSQMFWQYGPWKDGQLGLEITLPSNRWVSSILWEIMSTKDQSGPFEYYDRETGECLYSGGDSYYNHYIYQSWQYYGMGMGNPLIPGPAYNNSGSLTFRSNRVRSNHFGIAGQPSHEWNWRLLASYARHWGTYGAPLDKERNQFSGMVEITYTPDWAKTWSLSATCALDRGNYLSHQVGGMLTLRKTGGFNL